MGFDEFVDLLGAISSILAAVIAFFTAKFTTRKEFRKLELQWKREDNALERQALSDMCAAVSKYLQSGWSRHQREALGKISSAKALVSGDLLDSLAKLHESVLSSDTGKILTALTEVNRLWRDAVKSE